MLPKTVPTLFHRAGLADDIFNSNGGTLIAEIGTPLISCPGRVERSIMCQDFKGNHLKLVKDANQDMKDFVIKLFPKPDTEVGKGTITREVLRHFMWI